MARKQGGGAGSLEARGPGGVKQQHGPRMALAAAPCRSRSSGTGGLGGTQSTASLAPSQASNGCREFFWWKVWYHTTLLSCSTSLKLTGLEGMQVKQSCGLHFSAASEEESMERSTWKGEVAAGSLGPWKTRKMWSLSLILNKIKGNSNQKEVKMLATPFFPSLG